MNSNDNAAKGVDGTSMVDIGSMVLIDLPISQPRGHEQQGLRPGIIVGIPRQPMRYDLVIVVPLTSQTGSWRDQNPVQYPILAAGIAGLTRDSIVLLDQIRAVDVKRVKSLLGCLEEPEYSSIQLGLRQLLELN